ncbi:MAG: cytochrome b/b6 domain-containing protein [Candidatus Nanopelagicales bacterium]
MTQSEVASRFTRVQVWVHWSLALLVGGCLLTAAILSLGPLSTAVGHRDVVGRVHVVAGLLLPLPIVLGLFSATFREDIERLNRFRPADWQWLRSRDRRSGRIPVEKYNAGQKLNSAFTVGTILVMLGTGVIMRYLEGWPVFLRTGATWVHDWLAFFVLVVVIGHIWMARRWGQGGEQVRESEVG